LTAAVTVLALPVAMIEPPFRTLLVAFIGAAPLVAACLLAALGAAIAVSAVAVGADVEDRLALQAATGSLQEYRFPMSRRHALPQAALDNGARFVSG